MIRAIADPRTIRDVFTNLAASRRAEAMNIRAEIHHLRASFHGADPVHRAYVLERRDDLRIQAAAFQVRYPNPRRLRCSIIERYARSYDAQQAKHAALAGHHDQTGHQRTAAYHRQQAARYMELADSAWSLAIARGMEDRA